MVITQFSFPFLRCFIHLILFLSFVSIRKLSCSVVKYWNDPLCYAFTAGNPDLPELFHNVLYNISAMRPCPIKNVSKIQMFHSIGAWWKVPQNLCQAAHHHDFSRNAAKLDAQSAHLSTDKLCSIEFHLYLLFGTLIDGWRSSASGFRP